MDKPQVEQQKGLKDNENPVEGVANESNVNEDSQNAQQPNPSGDDRDAKIDYQSMALQDIKINFSFKTLLTYMGPGLLVAAGYLDPGNIAADITAGIENGNKINWALAVALCMCYFYQSISMRMGAVTGKDMATLIHENVHDKFTSLLYALMLTLALFAFDILQVIGTGIGFQIIFGVPLWLGVLLTFVSIGLIYMVQKYEDAQGIEIIFVCLMFVMAFCFFIDLGYSDPDWLDILVGTVVPYIPGHTEGQLGILSLFGATLLPHSLFMQSGMVKEKKVDPKDKYKLREIIYYSYIETAISIIFCLFINLAVIATFTHWSDSEEVKNGQKIDLFTAGAFFEKDLGAIARIVYGIGLISAGLSNMIPITISFQFYMEGFLKIHVTKMDSLFLIRIITIIPTLVICRIFAEDMILDELNIFQIVMIPVALIPLLQIMRSKKLMGASVMKDCEFYIMAGLGIFLVLINSFTLLPNPSKVQPEDGDVILYFVIGAMYASLIAYMLFIDYSGPTDESDEKTGIEQPQENQNAGSGAAEDADGELVAGPNTVNENQ